MCLMVGLCVSLFCFLGATPVFRKLISVACKSGRRQAATMAHAKQTRVLLLNDMEKLDKTLFRLEQGQRACMLLLDLEPELALCKTECCAAASPSLHSPPCHETWL